MEFEFPNITDAKVGKKSDNKSKKAAIPEPQCYKLPTKLESRLKNAGRKINIFNRINIKIKPSDINTCLQHLV